MKLSMKRFLAMVLVLAIFTTSCLTAFAEGTGDGRASAGDVLTLNSGVTWAEAGKQMAGMLGFIVEDAANIDLSAHSERIANVSLEDDSVYLAILAENGYLPGEIAQIDPAAAITAEDYVLLMTRAFPTVVNAQAGIDSLMGEADPGNIAVMGDDLSMSTLMPERLAVVEAQNLSLTAIKTEALSLNAASSVDLSESEIARVHIHDAVVKHAQQDDGSDLIYLHMDAGTQLPEVIVKSADEVVIEGSGALGIVRVQEAVGSLTVRATGSVVNETDAAIEVTGPDAQAVTLQPGEQVDFVLSKWLVSFVTEGTPVDTQEIAPGGMVDYAQATTTLEGKIFTSWYEDEAYTQPVSRLSTVDRQMTLYARFVDASEAVTVTFETFGGRALEPMVFAKGEYLLTKPVEKLYTSKEGYSFGGWCVDEECTTGFGYTDPIEQSMTLYALYSSYEQEVREDPGTVAAVELPDGSATIGLVLPEGMTADEAKNSITVEAGTGLEAPEIAVRETAGGAELYCEAGFTPGTTFTLYVQDGVQFAGYPDYIDTLTVSVYREQVEVVEFAEGLTYVLWDSVTGYTPVSAANKAYTTEYAEDGTVHSMLEDHDAQGDVVPGKLIVTGEVTFQPEQVVVFYDGEINRDEAPVDAWEGGDLAGYVLFAKILSVEPLADGTTEVTFRYADPAEYIAQLDVHTTEAVNVEEQLSAEQLRQVEKAIASQLAANDELKAQMLVAVMTSEDTQRMLDDMYGEGTYSLAALIPYVSDPKLHIELDARDNTVIAGIGVGITVTLYGPQGPLVELTPYLYFEEQLTLDINVDGGVLWLDMSVLFKTKTTIRLELTATSGGGDANVLEEAKNTLEMVVLADGSQSDDVDYEAAAESLMTTMQDLIDTELEYQDLFAVTLFHHKHTFYGIITLGINVELVGQFGVLATFGVEVMTEYGYKIGFNYDFEKFEGGSYKQKLASEVTTEIYLIGKIGVRVGIGITLSVSMCHVVTVSITGSVFAYVELTGMFMYTYALSAGGGNYFGSIYLEVGIDIEIELGLEVEILVVTVEKSWTLWSHRWPLYSLRRSMTMSVVQSSKLDELWEAAMQGADHKTSYPLSYLPMKTYNMIDGSGVENQLLFEDLQEGTVTAKLSLENVVINGEAVAADDPRIATLYVGDGEKGHVGVVYADEYAAAANKVESYQCDVVLTYENSNKSELIKNYRKVFPFYREFKIAVTTVNVRIALYDWCAHAWGIEAADWDNATLYTTTFENAHVLGCPVEPTGTGEVDLDAVLAKVREQYPDIDASALSWFNPTLNDVSRTVQYSIPRVSNLCYMTPGSETVRYDVFSTTMEYDLTFNLFASRYQGYTGEITYIIDAPLVPAGTVFSVTGSDDGETMTFQPVEGQENRWSLTAGRGLFDGTDRTIMMQMNGLTVDSGLVINGREDEAEVVLTLGEMTHKLTVTYGEGIDSWSIATHTAAEMSAITSGDTVTLYAEMKDGYRNVAVTTNPRGLKYTARGNRVSFTMPYCDVKINLEGVRSHQVDFLYNYGSLGTYLIDYVDEGEAIRQPADPYVEGMTFAGWYDNAACEGEPFDFTKEMDSDIILYADWRVNVTVDFVGPKGLAKYVSDRRTEEINGDIVTITETASIFPGDETEYARYTYTTHRVGDTALEYTVPNYDGYQFLGWYDNAEFTGEAVDPTAYVLTGGVTFYARWGRIAILTYQPNYGEKMDPYAVNLEYAGMPLKVIPQDPEREHYEFTGWYRTAEGGAVNRVQLDEAYIVEGTMTLYAGWQPVAYAVSYELGGGENATGNPVTHGIESDRLLLTAPTRTGYDFAGWEVSGIDALETDGDGSVYIPAGCVGDITLTAQWTPTVYTIGYTLIRGETAEPNPDTYTIEDADIVLNNPTADGYDFTGWTGTELEGKTLTVTIPAGSVGNREYKATWLPTDPVARIVAMALDVIPDENEMSLSGFTSVADFEPVVKDLLAADEYCSDYDEQLSVVAEQVGEPVEDGTSYTYTVKMTVTYTDDSGVETSDSKEVTLTVLKNPVTITVEVDYTDAVGGKYIPYGTALSGVTLVGKAVNAEGNAVLGTFAWADGTIVPLGANNGTEMYKVVFTPNADFAPAYSTAETLIAVNTQIGLQVKMLLPEEIEYSAADLYAQVTYLAGEKLCTFCMVDIDNGEQLDDVVFNGIGCTFATDNREPGDNRNIWIDKVTELQASYDKDLYVVKGQEGPDTGATVKIVRAQPKMTGTIIYSAMLGSKLSDIKLSLSAKDKADNYIGVDGITEWQSPTTELTEVGEHQYTVVFTPTDTTHYVPTTREVTVKVSKKSVAVPNASAAVTYDGQPHRLNVAETDDYTVSGNDAQTNAGVYTVTLTLKNPDTCMWGDGGEETATRTLTLTINKATLTATRGTNFGVTKLAYGQQLVTKAKSDEEGASDTKQYMAASDMISGVTVTDAKGNTVVGYWEWNDESQMNKALNASAVGDDLDFGDGYTVSAKFVPTSASTDNYEELTDTFPVQVIRSHPYYNKVDDEGKPIPGYLVNGYIFQPVETETQVSQLKEYDYVLDGIFINVITGEQIYRGSHDWEDPERYPQTSGQYNVVFKPWGDGSTVTKDPVTGELIFESYYNYTDTLVPVDVTVKHDVNVTFGTADGSEQLYNPSGYTKSEYTITKTPGGVSNPGMSFDLKVALRDGDQQRRYIDKIEAYRRTYNNGVVKDSKYDTLIFLSWENVHGTFTTKSENGNTFSMELVNASLGNGMGEYKLTTNGDVTSKFNRSDLYFKFYFRSYPNYVPEISTMSLARPMAVESVEPTTEPTVEPTAEPTVEPTTEPTVEPTIEPTAEPTIEPTEETIPVPGAIGSVVKIEPEQPAEKSGDVWQIQLEEGQSKVKFNWKASEPATEYLVYTLRQDLEDEEEAELELVDCTPATDVELDVADYMPGRYSLYVGAMLEDGSVTWGEAQFELIAYVAPTEEPTAEPTEAPTEEPTAEPSEEPTETPTAEPTEAPTEEPTTEPTEAPTEEPTAEPTEEPTEEPTAEPTAVPTEEPTAEPTAAPTEAPTAEPTAAPTAEPKSEPESEPDPEPETDAQAAE